MNLLPRSLAQVKGYWTAYVVLFVALSLTFSAYLTHSRYIRGREQAKFAQAMPSAIEQTRSQLGLYLAMMKGVRALFSAAEYISPDELATYFEVLKVHDPEWNRGMEGMGVILKVPPGEREAHIASMRKKHPDYSLSSPSAGQTLYPLVHLEALGTNTSDAIGWNVAEDALRREALQRVETTREAALSARTELYYPDGTRGDPGFVLYVPIFARSEDSQKAEVTGFVFGAFKASKLFQNIFPASNNMVTLEVYDGTELNAQNALFDEDREPHAARHDTPLYSQVSSARMFGQPWTFYIQTHRVFENSIERKIPAIMLLVGMLGSFILFGFVYAQVGARTVAENLTAELRGSETALKFANAELGAKVEESRRSSEALSRSLSLQLATLDATGDGILAVDRSGKIVSYNQRFLEMWCIPSGRISELNGDSSALVRSVTGQVDDSDSFVERIKQLDAEPHFECCDMITFRDGRLIERHSRPQRANDQVIGRVMSFRDVTEQRRAADKIAAEKDRLGVTLRAISDAVVASDRDGSLLLMNTVAEDMCGVSENAVRGMHIDKVFPLYEPASKEKLASEMHRILKDGSLDHVKPLLLINATGKQILVRRRVGPTHDSSGAFTGAVFVFQDVSQEQKAEQEQLRASKLESIGLLAGGIAHDFNNVLTGIVGNLSLLKEHPDLPQEVTERLGLLERSAFKARQLTMQLLTFAKGGSPIKQAASIVEVVRESVEFALRGSNLKAEFDFASDLSVVEIDTGQMSQVIQNLVINAKHAMPTGGLLRVLAKNTQLSGRENLPLMAGKYVRVSIEDFGCGISPENLSRIFDPYFTTKEKGSGLGLATAYSILKRHEGLMTVESEIGKGSVFHLYLPTSNAPAPVSAADTSIIVRGSAQGRILAMDDEPGIRTLLSAMLKHFGYDSTVVPDGAEAIREFKEARERGRPYHAVIMDLTIPGGMGGKETIRALREIEPDVRAIVSSGYSNDPVLAEYKKYGFIARVEKPFRMQELGKTLRSVLQPNA